MKSNNAAHILIIAEQGELLVGHKCRVEEVKQFACPKAQLGILSSALVNMRVFVFCHFWGKDCYSLLQGVSKVASPLWLSSSQYHIINGKH